MDLLDAEAGLVRRPLTRQDDALSHGIGGARLRGGHSAELRRNQALVTPRRTGAA